MAGTAHTESTSVLELLSPEVLAARLDPAAFSVAVARFATAVAGNPVLATRTTLRYAEQAGRAGAIAMLRGAGMELDGPARLPRRDPRFADPAWTDNPLFYLCRQLYTLAESCTDELLTEARLDGQTREKARFAVGQLFAALAPTNVPALNPTVLKKAFDTGGLSVLRGMRNMVRDGLTNSGRPRQLHPDEFTLGGELACTPGKVVYRNRLMELIQYEPQTETVYATPLLFSPPWINKYYIMDLAPERSLIEWAVRHGHTCFVISYRNPDEELRDVTMSDYLLEGPAAALDVVAEVTGAEQVNLVALCLGGTLAAALCAWLAARDEQRVASLTLLNTLLDFSCPGELGVLTDPRTVDRLEWTMRERGYLPAEAMRNTFDLLRANDLVWNYVVGDWMLGEEPTPFDILGWNGDSTRMPAAMHTEYLRTCYVDNQLARGEMTLAGQRLDLGRVTLDSYVVSAENDHIAPWKSVYTGARKFGGTVRFTLSNAGHIAGVVNPPNAKSKHWVSKHRVSEHRVSEHRINTSADLPEDPERWRAQADEVPTTWWEDWTEWIAERGGDQVPPPRLGSENHPATADAPGTYVRQT
ncbi:MAG: PHA/PHB synthase family protein [Sciscionella sp.]